MSSAINKYEHPFVTVDAVVLRYEAPRLMVLLTKRPDDAEVMGGRWALPGGFVNIDETLEDAMRRKVAEKTSFKATQDADVMYAEQLKTYDAMGRDPRGRVVSVAYIGLSNANSLSSYSGWFILDMVGRRCVGWTKYGARLPKDEFDEDAEFIAFDELAFDHGSIIEDAIARLAGKIWYTDILSHLLPKEYTIVSAEVLCALIEGHPTSGFYQKMLRRCDETGQFADPTKEYPFSNGKPVKLYTWKG